MTVSEYVVLAAKHLGPGTVVSVEQTADVEGTLETVYRVGRRGDQDYAWTVLGQGPTFGHALRRARRHMRNLDAPRIKGPPPQPLDLDR